MNRRLSSVWGLTGDVLILVFVDFLMNNWEVVFEVLKSTVLILVFVDFLMNRFSSVANWRAHSMS